MGKEPKIIQFVFLPFCSEHVASVTREKYTLFKTTSSTHSSPFEPNSVNWYADFLRTPKAFYLLLYLTKWEAL